MATVKACKIWNNTGFTLTAGETYRFTANGKWKDASTECDATGYESAKLRRFVGIRRVKEAKWFSLIGAVEKEKSAFFDIGMHIESGLPYTATRSGTLYCFANDVIFMYWNNSGAVDLEMERDQQGSKQR